MKKDLYINIHGIDFVVTVDYEQDYNCCAVSDVLEVRLEGQTTPLKCDTNKFYNELVDVLQEGLESELLNDKLVAEDMMYESARDEGLL